MSLSDASVISDLHENLFSMTRVLKKGFQVKPEGEAPILKKFSTKIQFDEKMSKNGVKGFLLTAKFCNIPNNADIFAPKN